MVRAVLALSVVTLVLGLVSCGSSEANGTVVRVRPVEAVRLIADGDHAVIDLRSPSAFAAGHVAGARNIDASAPDFEDRIAELDDGQTYLVYARTKADSAPAADEMVRVGIDRVVDAGAFGMLALAGAPLES
jgi:rhodanese-related sulfurtransferase